MNLLPLIKLVFILVCSLSMDVFAQVSEKSDSITVYSARKEHLIKPIFELYEKQTGIRIKYVTDKAGALIEKLKAEGKNTPADIIMTVDAGNLWQAAQSNLLAPVQSPVLAKQIPAHLRDPENRWFGLSLRARTVVYHKKKVQASELSTYEALAGPQWKGRLCLRTAKKVYNQSLVAMFIEQYGEKRTEKFVKGWMQNLAAPVFSNDTAVIKAIASGQCDVGIVNSYYYGRYIKKNSQAPLALFWPNQAIKDKKTAGVHVNISGAGILKSSKNKEKSKQFLEWLSGKEGQYRFAELNLEYPVHPKAAVAPVVTSWGKFKTNLINISFAGAHQAKAIRLMDKVRYK